MAEIKSDSLQDLMAVVNSADIGLVILDQHFNIRVWNLFMVNHSGLSTDSVMKKNLFETFPEIAEDWFAEKVQQSIKQKQKVLSTWEEQPFVFKFKNICSRSKVAAYMYQNITFIPLASASGEINNIAITINDVTNIAASTQQLDVVVKEYSQKINKIK